LRGSNDTHRSNAVSDFCGSPARSYALPMAGQASTGVGDASMKRSHAAASSAARFSLP
jgi:hypothetical protein